MRQGSSSRSTRLGWPVLLLSSLSLAPFASSTPHDFRELHARNIIDSGSLAASYDFVIAGGGTAGLVLASRLSEDANTTVLVLEAGASGDEVINTINTPADTYYSSLTGSSFDWAYTTVPQPHANNRSLPWARGKVLGGSSAINGMYYVRPSAQEVNAMAALIEPQDGAQNASLWNWDSLFAMMTKGETFTPPGGSIQQVGDIEYNLSSHGSSGPLHDTYPGFLVPIVSDWVPTLTALGVPENADPAGGSGWGSFIATSSINPSNWTRSYSRSAYIDPLPPRPNLAILPSSTVTKIVFASQNTSAGFQATSVQFASARGAQVQSVNVNREVLLAGGAIGSPQMLMVSGVGPADVLQAAGVDVVVPLPGVGQHLQDHISAEVLWSTTQETAGAIEASGDLPSGVSESTFMSYINSATAYVNTSTLFTTEANAATFQSTILTPSSLIPSTDPTVLAGAQALSNLTTSLLTSPLGQIEILLSLTGSGTIAVQAALQKPFSQGRLWIQSADVFDYPLIDPGYLSNNADLTMMRQGLKMARLVGQTAPLSSAVGTEVSPGPSVQTDQDWENWLVGQIGTEYHPSCSCAMLPLNQGGVVDSSLKVYGLANVRIVDASVFATQFSAHLEAPVYGLAEQASRIIRAQYNGIELFPTNSTTSSTNPTSTSTGGGSPTAPADSKNGRGVALRMEMGWWSVVVGAVMVGAML